MLVLHLDVLSFLPDRGDMLSFSTSGLLVGQLASTWIEQGVTIGDDVEMEPRHDTHCTTNRKRSARIAVPASHGVPGGGRVSGQRKPRRSLRNAHAGALL